MKSRFLLIFVSLIMLACKKQNTQTATVATFPTIVTDPIVLITSETAATGGIITSDGGGQITAKGICWNTSTNPVVSMNHTNDGTGSSNFSTTITGLVANTTYYVRAYATNSAGTAYGNEVSFTTSPPSIYIIGYEYNSNGFPTGKLWKNGVTSNIGNPTTGSDAVSIYVLNKDVYIGGQEKDAFDYHAKIWKNGVATQISNFPNSNTHSILVSGADIYAGGTENDFAKTWKNGVATTLTITPFSSVGSIFISGNDFYAAGSEDNRATLWKNGVRTYYGNPANPSYLTSVWVSGTDVYLVGIEATHATIWKNGVATDLAPGFVSSFANSIFISGTDIYVAGNVGNIAKIWKNGIPINLTAGTNPASASGVWVYNSDVYAVGYEFNGPKSIAKFWKNGVVTNLTDGTYSAAARRIFIR